MSELLPSQSDELRFFQDTGLMFTCRRCSSCCRHSPGYVFLSKGDLRDLLQSFPLPRGEFFSLYLRVVSVGGFHRLSLREKSNFDCIFWEEGGCTVYNKRPFQCRSFPFWQSLLVSQETWKNGESYCPGINNGETHTPDEINSWLLNKAEAMPIDIPPEELSRSGGELLGKYLGGDSRG